MLFTEQELQMSINPFSILDEAVYLAEQEATILPQMVPIVENNRLQAYVVDFNGIRQLSESSGLNYLDSIVAVAESDGVALDQVCVAIDEADLIESPELAQLGPIVVRPLSELDDEFQFCLEAVNAFMETEDEEFLDLLSEEGNTEEKGLRHTQQIAELLKKLGLGPKVTDPPKSGSGGGSNGGGNVPPPKSGSGRLDASKYGSPVSKSGSGRLDASKSGSGGSNGGGNVPPPKSGSGGSDASTALVPVKRSGGDNVPPPKSGSGGSDASTALVPVKRSGGDNVPPPKSGSSGSLVPKSGSNGMSFGKKAAIGAGIAAAIGGGVLAYQHYKNKPKSVIAKRIAALRSIYQKFLRNAQANPEKAGIFKRMAAKILGVIDKLMAFLQRKADGR